MAQDAQLLLKVGLDLTAFRNSLATLGQAAAGYKLPIKVKFDRGAINNELNNLRRSLGRQKFNIELNIVGGLTKDQFEKIQDRLDKLSQRKAVEIPVSVRSAVTQKDVLSVVAGINKSIKGSPALANAGGKIRIGTSIKPSITQADVRAFKKAVTESLGDLSVNVKAKVQGGKGAPPPGFPDLMEYMRTQGMVGKTASGMEMRMRNEGGGAGPQRTVLDQIARAIFYMAGVDPAAIRAQQAERRRLPEINWPASVPPARGAQTTTTMALAPGRSFEALPGSAFASQRRLVGDILEPSLKEILRGAANAFVDAVRQGMSNAIRSVSVRDLGAAMRPMLAGGRTAGLLPAGVGRTPSPYAATGTGGGVESRAELFARREREARMRSALRGMDVLQGGGRGAAPYSYAYRAARPQGAIVPYAAGGAMVPGGGGPGGTGGGGGGGGRRSSGGGMFGGIPNISLPGAGAIRELGQEFAFATKQVLLFGQAYKLLAFVQDFPSQVGQAVSQLQSFRNTLAAISPTAQEAAASNDLILSLVSKYNIPLQSARDGFTKLYASMQPAGFSGDQVRDLFTGVSKAAATFGMSADKIDRVNYAFAQMASKGQVMSEELKGQLGDVLPGAMAIFAQAAGFKGPEAISKFSAALEDGRYKGTAMMELLNNVSVVLNQKFSAGAEGAAKTFQGAINNMQTSMKSLYESFEPIAVAFLNGVVTPVMNGIKVATDGLNAFFSGTRAETAGGFAIAQELEKLRPAFEGIKKNATDLMIVFQQFAAIALDLGRVFVQIAGNPVVGYLLRLYAIMLPINMALNVMKGLWALNSVQLLIFHARLATGTTTLGAFRGMMAATGATASATAASIRGAGLTLRAFFAATGVGLVVAGISILIERFMSMNQALADTRAKALGAAQAIRSMTATEARQAEFQAARDVKVLQQLSMQQQPTNVFGQKKSYLVTSVEQRAALERAGISTTRIYAKGQPGGLGYGAKREDIGGAIQARQGVLREAEFRQRQLQFEEQQMNKPLQFAEIKGGGGDASGAGKGAAEKAARAAERAAQQRRELNATLEQLREQLRIERESLETQEAIAFARADGNEKLAAFLQTQEKFYEIDEKAAKLQREFAAGKIKEAELLLKQQLLAIERKKVEITEEERLNAVLRERYGITNEVMDAARRARENAFGLNLSGGGNFRTDINLDPNHKATTLGEMQQKLADLVKTENQVKLGAEAIGGAFGQAFKDIVSGSMTAQEALANMMQSIASHFLEMAAQIIAQQITMMLYGTILKALGIGFSYSGPNFADKAFGSGGPTFNPAAFSPAAEGAYWQGGFQAFADGGVVNGPTLGLIGEGGEPEYVIPASKMQSAMKRYGAGARGAAVIPAEGGGDGGGMMSTSLGSSLTIDMRYSVERINSVDYVTADQFERGMARAAQQGAKQGEQLTLRRLQQSRSIRNRLGMT